MHPVPHAPGSAWGQGPRLAHHNKLYYNPLHLRTRAPLCPSTTQLGGNTVNFGAMYCHIRHGKQTHDDLGRRLFAVYSAKKKTGKAGNTASHMRTSNVPPFHVFRGCEDTTFAQAPLGGEIMMSRSRPCLYKYLCSANCAAVQSVFDTTELISVWISCYLCTP
jgi:hypothetical protein